MTWDLPEVRPDKRAGEDGNANVGEQVLADAVSRWRHALAREIFQYLGLVLGVDSAAGPGPGLGLRPRLGHARVWGCRCECECSRCKCECPCEWVHLILRVFCHSTRCCNPPSKTRSGGRPVYIYIYLFIYSAGSAGSRDKHCGSFLCLLLGCLASWLSPADLVCSIQSSARGPISIVCDETTGDCGICRPAQYPYLPGPAPAVPRGTLAFWLAGTPGSWVDFMHRGLLYPQRRGEPHKTHLHVR